MFIYLKCTEGPWFHTRNNENLKNKFLSMNKSKWLFLNFFLRYIIETWRNLIRNHYMKNWILIKSDSELRFGTIILVVNPDFTHFKYKIYTPTRWWFFHNPKRFVQNSQIQISVGEISDFRSTSHQYCVDFIDVMFFNILSKKMSRYEKIIKKKTLWFFQEWEKIKR